MKPYGPKAVRYEWDTDHRAPRKTNKAFKSSERWQAKRDIANQIAQSARQQKLPYNNSRH